MKLDRTLFFWAVNRPSECEVLDELGVPLNILVSAGLFWRGIRFAKRIPKPNNLNLIMVDSGAQQFTKFKGYPYTNRAYYYAACKWGLGEGDFLVALDYPLTLIFRFKSDPDKNDITLVGHRDGFSHTPEYWIRKTVENAVELVGIHEDLGWGRFNIMLPVQGLPLRLYELCLDLYKEHGLSDWPYWGAGSVCDVPNPNHVFRVITLLRKRLGQDKWIHAWGPSVTAMKLVAKHPGLLDSWDSSMWNPLRAGRDHEMLMARPVALRTWNGRGFIERRGVRIDRRAALAYNSKEWLKFLKWLERIQKGQMTLT